LDDKIKRNEMGDPMVTKNDRRGAYRGLRERPERKRQLGGARYV
jgi:hypothetical protein